MSGIEGALMTAIAAMAAAIGKLWHMQVINSAKLRNDLEERVKALEIGKAELQKRCNLLEVENQRLLTQFIILSSSHDSSPLPQWVKDDEGRVLAVNRAYERMFLIPRGYKVADYLHHTDDSVWPAEIGEEFRQNDQEVWKRRDVMDLRENIQHPTGEVKKMRIIKYPRYADGIEQPIGIAGIAIPEQL